MSGNLLNKYLDLIRNDINRKTLVTIACKIKIPGFTNHFNRPYIRKVELKKMIYNNLKGRNKLYKYDKNNLKKKERIIFNKVDLIDLENVKKNLGNFKKRIKKNFEIISLFTNENLEKVKKIIYKKCI